VQHVRKWSKEFKNGQIIIHDDDSTSWPTTSVTDMSTARVEAVILENK
jgi:hypothetical protein